MPAQDLALQQAVMMILDCGDAAFAEASPLVPGGGSVLLRAAIAAVIRAAYDPVMPVASRDRVHALRIAARLNFWSVAANLARPK